MKKLQNKKSGFTLIELLVVITIMGILATGATATYTAQIQRARDATRINNITQLNSAIEQIYQERGTYPNATNGFCGSAGGSFESGDDLNAVTCGRTDTFGLQRMQIYMDLLPRDPREGQSCANGSPCDYLYAVGPDSNDIALQRFNLSTGFENQSNIDNRASEETNAGNNPNRLEIGTGYGDSTFTNLDGINEAITGVNSCNEVSDDFALIRGNCEA